MSNVAKLKKRALDYEQKKQFDKALDAYMQVLGALGDHVDEGDVALFNRVGDLLLGQGNVSAAVDHYERAVDLYSEGGFHNNAIALCKKILRNAPGRNSVYYKLGRISARKGFTSDAKTNFLEYADRMQRIGHVDEAFRALKEFADLCPDQDDIRLMLAEQLVRGERNEEAIEQLELHYEKLLAEGRAQEAKATLERILAIDPSHQPKTGVSRPTPKANDLIFLDVGFDTPGAPSRAVTGSVPVVLAADAPSPSSSDGQSEPPLAERPLPLIHENDVEGIEIAPVSGLSTDPVFDSSAVDGDALGGLAGLELIAGFEETSLSVSDDVADTVPPLAGLEQSNPLAGSDDEGGHGAFADELPQVEETAGERAPGGEESAGSEDELPLLDISLDVIHEDAPDPGNALTFIFPDGGSDWQSNGDVATAPDAPSTDVAGNGASSVGEAPLSTGHPDGLELPAPGEDELRIEPLLQLPELETPDESIEAIGAAPDLPLISTADEDRLAPASLLDDDPANTDREAPTSSTELHFLDLGSDQDPVPTSGLHDPALESSADATETSPSDQGGGDEAEGAVEASEAEAPAVIGAPSSHTPHEEPRAPSRPTLEELHTIVELNPDDSEARRRLAEALLEAGDRDGGLAELEGAMLAVERSGDLRGATAIVNEIIRVEPHTVRYHQKRVEYAVRANDRSLLAEAYYSLAESLFQMGEIEKSRAVYARVLELSSGDVRARAALQAIDAAADAESATAPAPEESPGKSRGEVQPGDEPPAVRTASNAPAAPAPSPGLRPSSPPLVDRAAEETPRPRAREPEPVAASHDFVNLADWLDEDAPVRNTRMVVDVKEPEIEEQVDFAEMLAMFKQGIAANVDDADHEAHYDLGVAYKEMGLTDEAISEFQKALRGTGNRARTYEALGQCFVERAQYQIAVTILSRALGDKSYTDDMLVGVLYLLGYACESLGRWADAQRYYERVFAVDIEFRDIADRLATAERAGK